MTNQTYQSNNYGTAEVIKMCNGLVTVKFHNTGNLASVHRPALYNGCFIDHVEKARVKALEAAEKLAKQEAKWAKRIAKEAATALLKKRKHDFSKYLGVVMSSNQYGDFEIIEMENSTSVTVKFINTGYIASTTISNAKAGAVRDKSI